MQPDLTPPSPTTPDAAFREAMQLIKDSRWTEAKRKLAEVAAVDPAYKNVAHVQAMVDEVLQTSFMGVGIPAHLQARIPRREAPPAVPAADDEADAPTRPSRPRINPTAVVGVLLLLTIVVVVLIVTRR